MKFSFFKFFYFSFHYFIFTGVGSALRVIDAVVSKMADNGDHDWARIVRHKRPWHQLSEPGDERIFLPRQRREYREYIHTYIYIHIYTYLTYVARVLQVSRTFCTHLYTYLPDPLVSDIRSPQKSIASVGTRERKHQLGAHLRPQSSRIQ